MPSAESHNTRKTEPADAVRSGGSPEPPGRTGSGTNRWRWLALARGPVVLPEVALAPRLVLLVLTMMLWLSLCLVLWRGVPTPPHTGLAELGLPAGVASSKLNNTSAEAPASLPPAAPTAELDKHPHDEPAEAVLPAPPPPPKVPEPAALPPLPVLEPLVSEKAPPPLPEPPPLTPVTSAPVAPPNPVEPAAENCYAIRDTHRGDSPMMSTWKMLGLHTVLAAAFTAPAALATEGPGAEPDATTALTKQIADLRAAIQALDKTVKQECGDLRNDIAKTKLATQVDLKSVNEQIAQLRADLEDLRKLLPSKQVAGYPADPRAELEEVRRQLTQLHQDMEALRKQLPATRVAGFPPEGRSIRLVNTFPAEVPIRVNDRVYYVAPGETRLTEPIPFGTFTYEVLLQGLNGPRTRTNSPTEGQFTIHVHPQ
jgi:hypothetical protein